MENKYLKFSFLWPLAHLFHFQWGYYFYYNLNFSLLIFALLIYFTALLCLLKPSKVLLLTLASLQLTQVIILLPEVPSHYLLIGLINLNLIYNFVLAKLRKESDQVAWDNFQLSTCWSVAIFYSWTLFWKLNQDFVNYQHSCAVQFALLNMTIPNVIQKIIPHFILLVELLIPLLLLVKCGRKWGIILAIFFHAALLIPSERFFLNFSFTMLALVLLFTKENKLDFSTNLENKFPFNFVIIGAFLLIILIASGESSSWFYLRQYLALIIYPTIAYLYLKSFSSLETRLLVLPKLSLLLVPLIVLINGSSPILGLKTSSSWQMYGNLQLSEKTSNHFIIPRSLGLGGYLQDRIKIIQSTDLQIEEEMPYLLLSRHCLQNKCYNLTYERNGQTITTNGEQEKKDFLARNILEKKLLNFNAFNSTGKDCHW